MLTSCSGGGTTTPPDNNIANPGYIQGTVDISGTNLASLDDSTDIGGQDETKWGVWLIDPTEDVDGIELDNDATTIIASDVPVEGTYILQIDFLPAVDLTGGDTPFTPVKISVPVTIEEAQYSNVDVSIEVIANELILASRSVSQANGYTLRIDYNISGPQSRTESLELHWLDYSLRVDSNGDGMFADEPEYMDSDRDGLSDEHMERLRQYNKPAPQTSSYSGELRHVAMSQRQIRVENRTFHIDESTRVYSGSSLIHISDLATGTNVRVDYTTGRNGRRYATEIRILP